MKYPIILSILLFISCSPAYRVTELESFIDPNNPSKPPVRTYAVTINNMVIPELSIDRKGNYPTSREEAEKRLKERKDSMTEELEAKYAIPNSFAYQTKKNFFAAGFTLVSPIAIPVMAASRSSQEEEFPEEEGVVADYFKNIAQETVPTQPVLRDELNLLS